MKKLLLLSLILGIGHLSFAQIPMPSKQMLNVFDKVELKAPINKPTVFTNNVNHHTRGAAYAPNETIIGNSYADMWTNRSVNNRLYRHEDGRMSAVFIIGFQPGSWPDIGTGYNYFDGNEWGPVPTERIETVETAWPNIAPLGDDGEIIFSHGFSDQLIYSKRDVFGSGTWEELTYAHSSGPDVMYWPRMITSGEDLMSIHVLASSYFPYMGMDNATVYSRSTDGGVSWDNENMIIEGMGPDYYSFIDPDSYIFAYPQGDTLAFLVAGALYDMFMMKSTDNGDTWEKTVIWEHPYPFFDYNTTITDTFFCVNNSANITLDANGIAHVVFGISRVYHTEPGTSYWYKRWVDGIGYWNEEMETFSNHIYALAPPQYGFENSEMVEDVNYIGWMQDVNGDGVLNMTENLMYYDQFGPSVMPSITVDEYGRRYVIFSSATETFEYENYNYRHIWARAYENGVWGEFVDLSQDVIHMFDECIWPVLAHTSDDHIHYIYQADDLPGLAAHGAHGYQENRINYGMLPKVDLLTNISDKDLNEISNLIVWQNFPNPFNGLSNIKVEIEEPAELSMHVTNNLGQKVMEISKGYVRDGSHTFTIDASKMPPGIYFYTVTAGSSQVTKKMIVK